jgi:hypothetical protein
LTAADSRRLSHVVADTSSLYGVNLAVDRIVLPETATDLDTSSLQQLCGRVGRAGKSTSAEVVLPLHLIIKSITLAENNNGGGRDDIETAVARLIGALRSVLP